MTTSYLLAQDLIVDTALTLDPLALTALDQALLLAQEHLRRFARDPEFSRKVALAFGEAADAEPLRQAWLAGDFDVLSGIDIRTASEINGANGAYSATTDQIYLSAEFLMSNQSNPDALAEVLLEEAGHRIDAQLNLFDRAGDEGAYFSALVLGNEISSEYLAVLQAEDDNLIVKLNEQSIKLEQNTDLVTIEVIAQWTDSAGNMHPVRNVEFELLEDDLFFNDSLGKFTTDNDGKYLYTTLFSELVAVEYLGPEAKVFVDNLYSKLTDYSYSVEEYRAEDFRDIWGPSLYKFSSTNNTLIPSPGSFSIDITFPNNDDRGKAFSILDALYVGHQYALSTLERVGELPHLYAIFGSPKDVRIGKMLFTQ